jgi:hypothetical protein
MDDVRALAFAAGGGGHDVHGDEGRHATATRRLQNARCAHRRDGLQVGHGAVIPACSIDGFVGAVVTP